MKRNGAARIWKKKLCIWFIFHEKCKCHHSTKTHTSVNYSLLPLNYTTHRPFDVCTSYNVHVHVQTPFIFSIRTWFRSYEKSANIFCTYIHILSRVVIGIGKGWRHFQSEGKHTTIYRKAKRIKPCWQYLSPCMVLGYISDFYFYFLLFHVYKSINNFC